jgi:hypothetical protein
VGDFDGDGTFAAIRGGFGLPSVPGSVALGDFDGDADLDLAVANAGPRPENVSILLGNGDGTFGAAASYGAGRGLSVAVGDFDGDADLDLAVSGDGVSILLNYSCACVADPDTGECKAGLPLGDRCAEDGECSTDFCVDGVCCEVASCPAEESCQRFSGVCARPGDCAGDCNGNGEVAIGEIVTLVNIGLGEATAAACPYGVPSGAAIDIALVIQAVDSGLHGCGVSEKRSNR